MFEGLTECLSGVFGNLGRREQAVTRNL